MIVVAMVACVGAVVVAVLALRAPVRVVLPVYAGLVPFGSGVALPIGLPAPFNTVTTLAGLAAIAALALHLVLVGSGPRIHPSVPVWLLFVGLAGLSFTWSINPAATLDSFTVLVSLVALYVVAVLVRVGPEDVRRLRAGIVLGGVVASAYGFQLLLTGNLMEKESGIQRFATAGGGGEAGDPNITAAVLLLPLVLAVWRAMEPGRLGVRVAHGLAGGLIGVGLFLTASRGGIFGAVLAVAILIAHGRSRRTAVLSIGALVGIVVFAAGLLAPEQFERLEREGSTGRTDIWEVGLVACERYCLAGSGLDTFADVHRDTKMTTPDAPGPMFGMKPHNIWLGTGVELGVAGLLLLVVALTATVVPLWRLERSRRGPPLAALAGVLAANFFLANLQFKYFWLVLLYAAYEAVAVPAPDEGPVPEWHAGPSPAPALLTAGGARHG